MTTTASRSSFFYHFKSMITLTSSLFLFGILFLANTTLCGAQATQLRRPNTTTTTTSTASNNGHDPNVPRDDDPPPPPPPFPKPYPAAFSISFLTNITRNNNNIDPSSNQNVTSNDNDKKNKTDPYYHPILGTLFYDDSSSTNATAAAQRIDHDSGSFECLHFYQHDQPCSLIFLEGEGMYRILHYYNNNSNNNNQGDENANGNDKDHDRHQDIDCCLDLKGIGPPPRDWATRAHPTDAGYVADEFSGWLAQEWIFEPPPPSSLLEQNNKQNPQQFPPPLAWPYHRSNAFVAAATSASTTTTNTTSSPADIYHTSRQTLAVPPDEAGMPLLFTFPGSAAQGRQDYHYIIGTMEIVDSIDRHLFDLPDSCRNRMCSESDELSPSSSSSSWQNEGDDDDDEPTITTAT